MYRRVGWAGKLTTRKQRDTISENVTLGYEYALN